MAKTQDWTAVTTFDDALVYKDGNRRITLANLAAALNDDLETDGFMKSTTALAKMNVVTTAVNYTVTTANAIVLVDCSGASRSVTLPAASTFYNVTTNNSNIVIIKRNDNHATFTCTINPDGAETIDGAATLVLSGVNYPFAWLMSDGSNWFTIG